MNETIGAALEFSQVRKQFGAQRAVDDLTLNVPAGCVYALLGPNGAGKSTTVRLAMGLAQPDAGSIRVLGRGVLTDAAWVRQHVGYVPELHFIYRWMRVDEAIRFTSSFYPTWNSSLCDELLTRFRLDPRKKVRHMSKGMVVKLALLLALSHEPEVLILDEATSGLDPLVREELLDDVLRRMCDGRRTVLLASHTLQDVQRLADRVGILYDGKLLVDRPIDELIESTKTIRAVLSDVSRPRHAPVGTIFEHVDGREWSVTLGGFSEDTLEALRDRNPVEHLETVSLSLEDIFKAYIRGRRAVA